MSGYKVDAKVVLLGKEYGGKTSIVERYLHNRYSGDLPYQNTIGAAYGAKRVEAFGRTVVLGIILFGVVIAFSLFAETNEAVRILAISI